MYDHNAVFPSITSSSQLIKHIDVPSTSIRSDKVPQSSTLAAAAAATTRKPSIYTVVIGKGKTPRQAQGNSNLKSLVRKKLEEYVNAKSRRIKSLIVTGIYNSICKSCLLLQVEEKEEEDESLSLSVQAYYYSAFVRYDGKLYTPVTDDSIPREKITSEFRNYLSDRYKSSSKNKVARRRLANKKEKESKHQQLQQQLYETHEEQEVPIKNIVISQQRLNSSTSSSKISIGNVAKLSRIETFNDDLSRSFGLYDAFDSSTIEV
ncbi:hypothetical protein FRACYDRAFT_272281 [Fragilariopsis cylindrus CCMP1102]|uniref:DUF6824 domain-containing protein n=1 Tax=Fragilariopsis cylindrus CCMP1102 TaxID=635003 RepID=A0A1E7EM65_9STRA|nr:hypothetical protein FRACYDRAFT_272281 [Fragilariopsis cylindrus CCMP1102]|eukprot:OEU07010.1 hypothetical protein FRACYDRAFT_272281 [Fragilariopsis cylindrus CCMP1102]